MSLRDCLGVFSVPVRYDSHPCARRAPQWGMGIEAKSASLAGPTEQLFSGEDDYLLVLSNPRAKGMSETAKSAEIPSLAGQKRLRFIEFYAGVGGWTTALHLAAKKVADKNGAGIALECCAALDHSDLCNSVYQHNHREKSQTCRQCRIEEISPEQLNQWSADMWLMSPPCQPHTRQHSNQDKDLDDARSTSFLHLVHLLKSPHVEAAAIPSIIVGFQLSNSFDTFLDALTVLGYHMAHFILEPTQLGYPNDRPRYFAVAIRNSSDHRLAVDEHSPLFSYFTTLQRSPPRTDPLAIQTAIPALGVHEIPTDSDEAVRSLAEFLDEPTVLTMMGLQVSPDTMKRTAAWCFDIVAPASRRSACFTSGYGRFIRGTGSILYIPKEDGTDQSAVPHATLPLPLQDPKDREFQADWIKELDLDTARLRYFSGTEMARLLGFPLSFSFPTHVTTKQQWKLMGNSLNVSVAAKVIELGLHALKFR